MMGIGGTQNEILVVAKVNQAGIALRKLHNERNNTLENFLQAHVPNHETADLLEKPKLLLNPLEAAFQVFCLRHYSIIG
jgi:hypothetical protein